jgi:hypothetical protein
LGKTQFALASNDRFFRSALASNISQRVNLPAAAVLQLQGTGAASDGSARANRVQILGVGNEFWQLALAPAAVASIGPNEVVLNRPLAEQLRAKPGDEVLLRVENPSRLSREAPLTPQEDFAVALRATVRGVVSDEQLGRFSLQANQVAPLSAFFSSAWLSEKVKLAGQANLLLVGGNSAVSKASLDEALRQSWQLADAELEIRELPGQQELGCGPAASSWIRRPARRRCGRRPTPAAS